MEQDVNDYLKAEVIRRGIQDVRERAKKQEDVRLSPTRVYRTIKSKVAGNMKSLDRAKKRAKMTSSLEQLKSAAYFNLSSSMDINSNLPNDYEVHSTNIS